MKSYMYSILKSIVLALCIFLFMIVICGIEDWLGITIFSILIMIASCISNIVEAKHKSKHN